MESDPGPPREPEARLAELADVLVDGLVAALPGWVEQCVSRVAEAWSEDPAGGTVEVPAERLADAGRRAADEVGERLRALLDADVDEQWTGPLAVLRDAVRFPTELLRTAGVPPVDRDGDAVRMFPDDLYDLTPSSFADVHPDLQGPGLAWGAAKAFVHRRRHLEGDGSS
ncbi:MAG TPA: hypothetical protein QF651_00790 [Acidimicrobiales bacterium]|jgi:hypothetical protein|nr:hypothetical protein [Acidimicrobiales bacterium]